MSAVEKPAGVSNSDWEIYSKLKGIMGDVPVTLSKDERLDALEAEIKLLNADADENAAAYQRGLQENERLRAELATAQNNALEQAARVADGMMAYATAETIRALKREGSGNG